MSFTVAIAAQVREFGRRLAPEPRQQLRRALLGLRSESGDIRQLEGNLAGYHRLRVGRHRVLFRYVSGASIDVLFVEERGIVYEVFAAEMLKTLKA
jgi:mRNA interferase RelE/StbE